MRIVGAVLRLTVPTILAAALTISAAVAAPIVVQDTIDVAATRLGGDYGSFSSAHFQNRAAGGKHWGDEISSPSNRFDTSQITVDRDNGANTITFTMRTMFDGDDGLTHYADLFLDTSTPDTPDGFNYAIALGGQGKGPGVYTVDAASTSNAIWGGRGAYVYGGFAQFKTTSPDFDPNMALPVYTRLDSGAQLGNYTVTLTQTALGGGFFDVAVVVTALTDLSLFDSFDLLWGTGDCGNDTIWGAVVTADEQVTAPGALPLLIFGLLALWTGARIRRTPI